MTYHNGHVCDECGEMSDEIYEVKYQEKSFYLGCYEEKLEYLCPHHKKVLPFRNYPYIEIISSKRMPKVGATYVRS